MVSKTLLTIAQRLLKQNWDNSISPYYLYGVSPSPTDLRRYLVYVGIPIFRCAMSAELKHVFSFAKELVIDLSTGYLFWPTTPERDIIDKPILGSTAANRFKRYLREVSLD